MIHQTWKKMGAGFVSLMMALSVFALPIRADGQDKHIDYQIVVDDNTEQAILVDSEDVPGEEDDNQEFSWTTTIPSKKDFKGWMEDNGIDPDKHDMEKEVVVGPSGTYDLGEKVTFSDGQDETLSVYVYTEVTVTYMDGSEEIGSELVEIGHTPVQPDNPVKEGFVFDGWYADKKLTKAFDFAQPVDDDINVYAGWKDQVYTISYDLNQGTGSTVPTLDGAKTEFTSKDADFTLAKPKREGYDFAGWTGSNGDTPETDVVVPQGTASDLEYAANWTPKEVTYDVVLMSAGGVELGHAKQSGAFDTTILLEAPYMKDYITPQPQQVSFDRMEPKKITFVYTTQEYSITYDYNGGGLPDGQTNPARYTADSGPIRLLNPSRDGYTFRGWSGTGLDGDTNKEVTIETGSTGDRAYTANYDPFTYTVKYDANGAKGKIDDVKVQVGQAFALADGSQYTNTRTVAFESNGGSKAADQQAAVPLAGWTLGDNVFAPGQEVSNLSTKDKDTVTLKAQWADDRAVITLPSVTNGDKVLEGWYEDVTLTKKVGNPQETYAVKKDTKLYAKWKSVGFNVDNDGAVWEKGSKKPLEFTIHAEEGDADLFSHFTSLYNNQKKLNSKAFTATSGSVKLSINPDFLETLSPGRHTFTANFDDGRKADVHFTIQEAKAKKSEKTDGQKTGVNQNWLPWAAGIAVALIGVYVFRKKAKE